MVKYYKRTSCTIVLNHQKGFEVMLKKKYHKFTEQLMFAIVMRDAMLCRELVERIIPDRKVREIRFSDNPVMDSLAKSIADDADRKADYDGTSGWMTAETEKVIIPALLSKSVRFDALFEDDDACLIISD